jgi:1,4-dihydroxy-2-naphthoate octaprenyltransferase
VLVGTAAAVDPDAGDLGGIVIWRALAAMVVALAIQVGTNYANDYSDGKRGTDAEDRVGPLRLVGSGLATAGSVKRAAFAAFGVAAVAGFALALAVSLWLIPVGLVCFAAGWLYTGGPRPYGYAGLGEVFVFVFFGVVATAGSAFIQTEAMPWLGLVCSIPVGCLATALLVVNNLRDIPSDTRAGKRTLAVKLGDRRTRFLYTVLMVLPYVVTPVIAGASARLLASASLFTIVLARVPVQRIWEGATGPALIPVLGQTGRVQLVYGIVFAAGLCVVF